MALPGSSRAAVPAPSTRPAPDLPGLAVPVRLVGVPDLVHGPDSALRVLAALAARDPPVVHLRPVKRRVHSAHRKIAHAAAASNIRRPKKAR